MDCQVQGCPEVKTEVVKMVVHGVGCTDDDNGHHHGNPISVKVCRGHREIYEKKGWLPGLMIMDDPEEYKRVNQL